MKLALYAACLGFAMQAAAQTPYPINVDAKSADVLNHFSPFAALGAGVDGVPSGTVRQIYTARNIGQMLQSGFGAVSYRLYTELSVQDWHWNPAGTFSESSGTQGYWTSSATPGKPTVDTYGYRLPRRGFTHDQGNDDDYSRLDDGDLTTFWKSNPYLTSAYTGDPDSTHPQWVLVDLGKPEVVNAARIVWASPYAVQYAVQYWTGDDAIYDPANGAWSDFPNGTVSAGTGNTVTLALGTAPQKVRYIRVLMSQSSLTCTAPGSTDARDCTGYAIDEIYLGTLAGGVFTDLIKHKAHNSQTSTYTSSVDPWHTSAVAVRNQEQPGFDTVFGSGITRGLPATIPIPMLYSTPANAAAELAYLQARGDAIARVEMGEEPDGQYIAPEDYAALYVQFAAALHAVNPALQLGGPVFQGTDTDTQAWPDAAGQTSWTKRFIGYLQSHNQLQNFNFFSFEHYPSGTCQIGGIQPSLLAEPASIRKIMKIWQSDNLPAGTPILITETNLSYQESDVAQYPAGAIWYADMIGSMLSNGGAGAFFYEYEPWPVSAGNGCGGNWGTYGALLGNQNFAVQQPLAQFYGAQLVTSQWAQPVDAVHALYAATVGGGTKFVTAYPVLRPDGQWAILVANRDLANAHQITVQFTTDSGTAVFTGNVVQITFGPQQYVWNPAGSKSAANPDNGPQTTSQPGGAGMPYTLPAGSVTVIRGSL